MKPVVCLPDGTYILPCGSTYLTPITWGRIGFVVGGAVLRRDCMSQPLDELLDNLRHPITGEVQLPEQPYVKPIRVITAFFFDTKDEEFDSYWEGF